MKPLDKKQIPQFAALCVITAGLAGYLVMHLVAPGPVSAGTRAAATPAVPASAAPTASVAGQPAPGTSAAPGAPGDVKTADAAPAATSTDAPPPTPGMHDPFAVQYVDPATLPDAAASIIPTLPAAPKLPKMAAGKQIASISGIGPLPVSFPNAPALPGGLSGFPGHPAGLPAAPPAPALPTGPAAPTWSVTGVLQGADGKVAILRSGEARRIVRSGDFVDSTYRVIGVTRTSVTLRHGTAAYRLTLGAVKAVPAQPSSLPALPGAGSFSAPAMPRQAAFMDSGAMIPVYHAPKPKVALAHLHRQGQDLALTSGNVSIPHQPVSPAKPMSPTKIANSISLGLRLLDGSVMAQDSKDH